jgi:hypothetical protein
MKHFAAFAALILGPIVLVAQPPSPPPEITPTPAGSPARSPGPAPATSPIPGASPARVPKPIATPPPAPPARVAVDSLSDTDVQEAIATLRANFLNPSATTDAEINRATLQGLMERLSPGATILADSGPPTGELSPFRFETVENRIGYIRLGTLQVDTIGQLDQSLKTFAEQRLKAVVLDLRATPPGSDFDTAAEVIKRFCPKGQELFSIKKSPAKKERIFTSNLDPKFQGVLIVLADNECSGASEIIAAALRESARALVIGETTMGQAVEFADVPLGSGKTVRVAVARVVLPGGIEIFPRGVKPDITVALPDDTKRELLRLELEKGAASAIAESERPRMNEAALVAGVNPELEAMQAAQRNRGERSQPPPRDVQLQRAIDLVTTIAIYEKKTSGK